MTEMIVLPNPDDKRSGPTRKPIPAGQLQIASRWVDAEAGETMDVSDPTIDSSITHVQKASASDANRAIDAAYTAFEEGLWRPPAPMV